MNNAWTTKTLSDKGRILTFLDTDRLYAAYAIGDLEPDLFAQCTWAVAERGGEIRSLGLHFRGLTVPAFFLMGETDGIRSILQNHLPPGRVYITCRDEHLPVIREYYRWEEEPVKMWRMALGGDRRPRAAGNGIRLTAGHAGQIRDLVALGAVSGFDPAQIEHGVFFGIPEKDRLASMAGTHLVSPAYGVAAVGNVVTRPDRRGRGMGNAVVSAVLAELVRIGIRDIVLNARQENAPALHLYKKLGFRRHCAFWEVPASIRNPDGTEEGADAQS
jgi:GNAT superfamily N-acetyltransferase